MEVSFPCGRAVLIDPEDRHLLDQYRFKIVRCGRAKPKFYVRTTANVYLHRIIMVAKPGEYIDHINGNGLDCRRANMRKATNAQNTANSTRHNPNGFRGVHRSGARWAAQIEASGVKTKKTFATPEDAARAYDEMAVAAFGEFAKLNFARAEGVR